MRTVAATVGLILVAAACGGGVDAELITNTSERVQQAGSAKVLMRGETTFGGESSMTIEADGVVDFTSRTGRTTMSMSSAQFEQLGFSMRPCTMISQDQTVYAEVPEERRPDFDGKAWIQADLSEQMGIDPAAQWNDPSQMLEYMRGASSEIEEVGREEVRGVDTTHYRFTVSMDSLHEQLTGEKREEVLESIKQFGLESFPMDVWIGDDELPRRTRFAFEAAEPTNFGTQMTMEMFDYGAPIDVEIPSQNQVYAGDAVTAMTVCQGLPESIGSSAGASVEGS